MSVATPVACVSVLQVGNAISLQGISVLAALHPVAVSAVYVDIPHFVLAELQPICELRLSKISALTDWSQL